jgi:hypothetical protein
VASWLVQFSKDDDPGPFGRSLFAELLPVSPKNNRVKTHIHHRKTIETP